MAWNMTAVPSAPSTVKYSLDEIPDDVKQGVEEAYAHQQDHPTDRLAVAFETEAERDIARGQVRSYCEARPDGRLTASIWAPENLAVEDEDGTETELTFPLSMAFKVYVKKAQKDKE